jgi:hypothetical protein
MEPSPHSPSSNIHQHQHGIETRDKMPESLPTQPCPQKPPLSFLASRPFLAMMHYAFPQRV